MDDTVFLPIRRQETDSVDAIGCYQGSRSNGYGVTDAIDADTDLESDFVDELLSDDAGADADDGAV